MLLQRQTKRDQSGFSVIVVFLVALVVAALAGIGYVVYQRHKHTSSAATGSSQTTSRQTSTITTQTQQSTTQYLTVAEWGIKLPLSNSIKDAYYVAGVGSVGADRVTNQIYLGLRSLDANGCTAAGSNHGQDSALAMLFRAQPSETDPVTGKTYPQLYPDGVTLGNYFYGFEGFTNTNISTCKAPQATILSVDSAFATSAKSIVAATITQYLTIKEWGVKLPLPYSIRDAYYVVPDGISKDADGLPSGISLSVSSLDTACGRLNSGPTGQDNSLAGIIRVLPKDTNPVSGKLYTQLYPGGPTINGYYYAFSDLTSHRTCAPQTTLQSIGSAFSAAAKSAALASAN